MVGFKNFIMNNKKKVIFLSILLLVASSIQLVSDTTVVTSALAKNLFTSNLHEVAKARFFRSGEMSDEELSKVILDKGIKTVIDLRLDETDQNATIEQNGATLFHIPISSSKEPKKESVKKIIEVFKEAKEPILVHCSSGTHRTGFVTALWLMFKGIGGIEVIDEQLSPKYGFFKPERTLKAMVQGEPTLDQLLWDLKEKNKNSGLDFNTWLESYIGSTQ